MTKCTITVKKDGGNIFSNSYNVIVMSASTIAISKTIRILEQISLKKQANFIKGLVTWDGKDRLNFMGKSCCIKMWLSKLFKPKSCVLSYSYGMRYWKHTYQALLHPSKLARNHLSLMKLYENKRTIWYTYHHFFVVGGVHSLSPCPPSQGVPCNYPLFDPSSSAICQVYCLSHSSLYASH